MMEKRSLFITFEGGEGAGKTTLISSLHKELILRGYDVVVTREPGGSKLGNHIRQWLLNRDFDFNVGTKAELLLFLAARAQHIEELIRPALAAGKIVLCDRFNDSTVAYQGVARGLGLDAVQNLCDLVCDEIVPDLTFFIDVDPAEGLRRTRGVNKENSKAGEVDRIESEALAFHQRVRDGLQQLAARHPQRISSLDGHRPPAEVLSSALHSLNVYLWILS
jgi:dTMP kinase